MNPALVDSIRRRMREQTTEQLLELWVTNDRVMWSPEAFEAVKSLLGERGVKELPAQNDPAPVAKTHLSADDPVVRYWLGWLRPVLWICVAVSAASLPRLVVILWALTGIGGRQVVSLADAWRAAGTLAFWLGIIDIGLPLLLGIGAVGAFRLKVWSRPLLLAYAGVEVVTTAATSVLHLWQVRRYGGLEMWLFTGTESLNALVTSIALPALLWLLLRRPEIRSLFTPIVSGSAFETLPANVVAPNPTAP